MKAMVLAAGEGTRLRPLTLTLPKPMIPLVGKPLLERTLNWLAGQGVTEAAINLFHRPQAIPDYFGETFAGIRLNYFYEETLRGTAGGLKAAECLFQDSPFFVVYGDNLIQADLKRLADFHRSHAGVATLGLFHHPNPTAAGIVGTEADGRITRFVEKPPPDDVFSDTANAGVYVLDPSVLDAIPRETPADFGRDIFPALLSEGQALYGTLLGGYLQDTGTPQSYLQANWDMLAGKAGISFSNPDLWVSDSAAIGPRVSFQGRNVIGDHAVIGEGATLTNCIIWSGTEIAAGAQWKNVILANDTCVHVPSAEMDF